MVVWNKLSPLRSVSEDYKELKMREIAKLESCTTGIGFCPSPIVFAQEEKNSDNILTIDCGFLKYVKNKEGEK